MLLIIPNGKTGEWDLFLYAVFKMLSSGKITWLFSKYDSQKYKLT